jgi:hypothetical protein
VENEPNKVQVLEHLEKIVLSEEFLTSPRKRKFLRYIVEKTLEGQGASLKGYSIGVDVFERGDSFDPQQDTIVRVQAGNLRKALHLYYLTEGRNDHVLIQIAKGGYVPSFSLSNTDEVVPGIDPILDKDTQVNTRMRPVPIIDFKNLRYVFGLLIILFAIMWWVAVS